MQNKISYCNIIHNTKEILIKSIFLYDVTKKKKNNMQMYVASARRRNQVIYYFNNSIDNNLKTFHNMKIFIIK